MAARHAKHRVETTVMLLSNALRFAGAIPHALSENTMRFLSKLTLMAIIIFVAPAIFAQAGGTSTIAVEQPWARATPTGAMTGVVYMTLANKTNTADLLTAAASDVASNIQIHEMTIVNGIMQMRQLTNGLAIPAGGAVTLKPSSYHMMLIGLKKPLIAGQTLPLTLSFAKAGNISITVPIQSVGASRSGKGGMGGMERMQGNKSGSMGTMEGK